MMLGRLLLLCSALTVYSLPSWAGNIYKFRDADGNILFTNVVDGRGKPRGQDFGRYTKLEKVT
ncbi:MAG TPA: hypothetical protein PKY17_05625, partial [Agitococcus sp.]|nr:hypothetical protein [Agitococcus sp.]